MLSTSDALLINMLAIPWRVKREFHFQIKTNHEQIIKSKSWTPGLLRDIVNSGSHDLTE